MHESFITQVRVVCKFLENFRAYDSNNCKSTNDQMWNSLNFHQKLFGFDKVSKSITFNGCGNKMLMDLILHLTDLLSVEFLLNTTRYNALV